MFGGMVYHGRNKFCVAYHKHTSNSWFALHIHPKLSEDEIKIYYRSYDLCIILSDSKFNGIVF